MHKDDFKEHVGKYAYNYRDTSVNPGNFKESWWVLKDWEETGSSCGMTTIRYKVGISNNVWFLASTLR